MADPDVVELLRRTLQALEPWSDEVVLVGGWAMQLYRYLDEVDSGVDITLTKDVDLAIRPLKAADELWRRLEQHGLCQVPSRATTPALTYYQATERGTQNLAPSYVEFLTPLEGRSEQPPLTIAPRITAQRLRYLDLSFQQPITLELARVPPLADAGVPSVRIPSPASYLLAKSLIWQRRKPAQKDKDCAYIYLLARMTHPIWTEIRRDLESLDTVRAWRTRGYEQLRILFAREPFEGPVRAARSLADPNHTESVIRATVRRFLVALGIVTD